MLNFDCLVFKKINIKLKKEEHTQNDFFFIHGYDVNIPIFYYIKCKCFNPRATLK